MIEFAKHVSGRLYNVRGLIEWGGTVGRLHDRLYRDGHVRRLFPAGRFPAGDGGCLRGRGAPQTRIATGPRPLCAIAGDQLGYLVGWKAGASLYGRGDSRFFKKEAPGERAHDFYQKYGGKTIILARFVPIIRTFCPPVAGAAKMSYGRYLVYDIFGGLLWVWGMVLVGYTLGRTVPNVDSKIHYIIAAVIVLISHAASLPCLEGPQAAAPTNKLFGNYNRTDSAICKLLPEMQNGEPGSSPFCSLVGPRRCRRRQTRVARQE